MENTTKLNKQIGTGRELNKVYNLTHSSTRIYVIKIATLGGEIHTQALL